MKMLIVLSSLFLALSAHAQVDTVRPSSSSFGLSAGLTRDLFTSSFYEVPGCPQCSPIITNGSGLSTSIVANYRYHINSTTSLSLGVGYSLASGTMLRDEDTRINIDGVATPATIEHTVDVTLNRLMLQPTVGYQILPSVSLTAGLAAGYLLSPTFSSRERLVAPVGRGVFDNGQRTRDEYSGALPEANKLQAAAQLGVSYQLPMNALHTVSLIPSLTGSIGLTNILRGVNWKENGMGASLAIDYRPMIQPESSKPARRIPPPDTARPVPELPALLASLTAMGVDSSGNEEGRVSLRIEELVEVTFAPMIPYVFFDRDAAHLPERYKQIRSDESARFSEEKLPGEDRLAFYHEVLNVIGSRLANHPSARITLVACADPSMAASKASALAESRGKTVREYLATAWGIDSDRIAIQARTLPERPSPVADSDGIAEDRRVEIASNDPAILAPVFISDTIRTATPPTIRFRTRVAPEPGIANWRVVASQDGLVLKTFDGSGAPPEKLDWNVGLDQSRVPRAPGSLDCRLHIQDLAGRTCDTSSSIAVEQVTLRTKQRKLVQAGNSQAEIERYALLLFDFNSSDLTSDVSGQNAQTIALIKQRITNRSQVSIRGFGDRIGDPEYNRRLANERAARTAKALGLPASDVISADGASYPYDNNLPEGRFYSRTVEITIRTPIEGSN